MSEYVSDDYIGFNEAISIIGEKKFSYLMQASRLKGYYFFEQAIVGRMGGDGRYDLDYKANGIVALSPNSFQGRNIKEFEFSEIRWTGVIFRPDGEEDPFYCTDSAIKVYLGNGPWWFEAVPASNVFMRNILFKAKEIGELDSGNQAKSNEVATQGHNSYRSVIRVLSEVLLERQLSAQPLSDANEIIKTLEAKGMVMPVSNKTLSSYLKER